MTILRLFSLAFLLFHYLPVSKAAECRKHTLRLHEIFERFHSVESLGLGGEAQFHVFRTGHFLVHQKYGQVGLGLFNLEGELMWSLHEELQKNYATINQKKISDVISDTELYVFDLDRTRFLVNIYEGVSENPLSDAPILRGQTNSELRVYHLFLFQWTGGVPKLRPLNIGNMEIGLGAEIQAHAFKDGSFRVLIGHQSKPSDFYTYQELSYDPQGNLTGERILDTPRSIDSTNLGETFRLSAKTLGFDEASESWIIAESWDPIRSGGTTFRFVALGHRLKPPVWLSQPISGTWHHNPRAHLIPGWGIYYDTGVNVVYLPFKNPANLLKGLQVSIRFPERGDVPIQESLIHQAFEENFALVLGTDRDRLFIEKRSPIQSQRFTFDLSDIQLHEGKLKEIDYRISIVGSKLWLHPVRDPTGKLFVINLDTMQLVEKVTFDREELWFLAAADERRAVFGRTHLSVRIKTRVSA